MVLSLAVATNIEVDYCSRLEDFEIANIIDSFLILSKTESSRNSVPCIPLTILERPGLENHYFPME